MNCKWIGAILIVTGCGGAGFSIAAGYKRQEMLLKRLLQVIQFMEQELQYRMTPLPELCAQAGRQTQGTLKALFLQLSKELNAQVAPDVGCCMAEALHRTQDLPDTIRKHLHNLGHTLGRFDLTGQLQGLSGVREECRKEIQALDKTQENRLRSYRTLGICAGVSLAVLLA